MKGFVYIMTNNNNSVLYTGVTSEIRQRILQHKSKTFLKSFSSRYNICKLVYIECFETIGEAIKKENQIKAGSRMKKIKLINRINPEWNDLSLNLDKSLGLPLPLRGIAMTNT
jgi:putative endonuclease